MPKLALPLHILKNDHGRRESDLARLPERYADNASRHAHAAADVTASRDIEKNLEAEIAALKVDAERTIVEDKQKLSRLSVRFADLKHPLASYEPSTKQQKEGQP